jgi:hypothetical protein
LANARLNKSKGRFPTSRRNNRSSNYCSSGSKNGAAAYIPAVPATCECVRGSHVLVECKKFKDSSAEDRRALIKGISLRYISLSWTHVARPCSAAQRCKKCSSSRHLSLHIEQNNTSRCDGRHKPQATCNVVSTSVFV